jgi:hypothetical protein
MKVRELSVGMALLAIALVAASAKPPDTPSNVAGNEEMRSSEVVVEAVAADSDRRIAAPVEASALLSAVPSPLVSKDKLLGSAYFNTLSILSRNNVCSDFFGGPAAAVDVFTQLISRVRKDYFPATIGMSMFGETVNVRNEATKKDYRLFDRVVLNTNGPFYRKRLSQAEPTRPRIGTFEPNTREIRVLIFLHELGHAIKGEDGKWLLPDDGKSDDLSRQNSQKIEDVCGEQIKDLRNGNAKHEALPNAVYELKNN